MSKPEDEWFSKRCRDYLEIIRDGMGRQDDGLNDLLKMAVKVAFDGSNSPAAERLERHLRPMCRRCILEIDGREGTLNPDSPDMPLWTFLVFAGWAFYGAEVGDHAYSSEMAFNAGQVWGEIEAKFNWQVDADRGQRVGGGALNAARQANERHIPDREARFARLRELLPNMKLENAAAQCEVEGLGRASAIVRQWNRYKNKSDT